MVTFASGMAEPLESVTIPVITARSANWAYALCSVRVTKANVNNAPIESALLIFTPPADSTLESRSSVNSPMCVEPKPPQHFASYPSCRLTPLCCKSRGSL